jgi:flagellar hook-associated protein 1
MADMLNVAVSGLKAFQRALDTTSHNIANATTPGYSRQRVELTAREPEAFGGLNLGRGVNVSSVDRYYDSLLATQMRTASSNNSQLSAYADKAGAINNLFADNATGLSASLQKFTNALQGVANTPSSSSARQVLLSEAQGLAQRLQSYDQRLDEIDTDINGRMVSEASAITNAATNIARLNAQIVSQQATTGTPPNDLLDQRDKALNELATHLDVSVVPQDDGALNVFIGNGQSLVVGSNAATITTQADPYLPGRVSLAYQSASGAKVDLRSVLSGGTVGGLLDFRRELLDPARNELGQIAVGLTSAVNAQHREGVDLSGNAGTDLFSIGGVQVQASSFNSSASTAAVAVTRTSAGALTSSDYTLSYTAGAWSLRKADTGAAVAMTGLGTSGSPFVADGLSLVVSGTPAAGDQFLVQPTAKAIDGMKVLITDPAQIAAAAPIRTSTASTNLGTGTVSAGEVLDPTNSALRTSVQLQFTDATHYTVNGAGNFTYAPGGNIDVNGWRVAISGAPQAGDSFTVADNAGGVGDNRNALQLAAVLGKGVLTNGTESLNAASSRIVGRIGVAANQAQVSADAQQIIYDDSVAANDEVSGVNLDEEAANMLRYQQAYQAAAQVIRVTQDMFDALINATRR